MPFTVSHAVVAIPLRRTALPASAVAVGAMTPDLRLFVPVAPLYEITHSLAWLPVTTALAGLVWACWRFLVAPAASDLSPVALASRYPAASHHPGRTRTTTAATAASPVARLALTVAALALGVLTHVVWDAFTHHGRWGVDAVGWLTTRVGGTSLYTWLQDGSSVLGLVVIAIWFARLPRRTLTSSSSSASANDTRTTSRHRARWWRRLAVAGVLASLVVAAGAGVATGGPLWRLAYVASTTAVVGVVAVVVVTSLGWHLTRASAGPPPDPATTPAPESP
ncbi:DUF4184 domain-containing protein [Serinibacter arcticus]|uniref:DUF4184 domain-containing protein n=1 Tax=Serinibacter arcticus TaxID=1655435 RepID=A0A2U1ZUC4_9MICO|nr:DUF4184 family protein [Serinibacter arcticus]PWD50553.1 DUF4184 domain-containing protein [Serinibacter arcticus]